MTDEFIFDPKAHAYFLNGKPLSGITSILQVIAKPALIQWAAKMACEHIAQNADICPHSEDYLHVSRPLLDEARVAHRKKKEDAAEKGTDLHALVENYVRDCIKNFAGAPLRLTLPDDPIRPFANWALEEKIRFIASEQRLYSKEKWIAGTVDIIAEQAGKLMILDIKTYKKIWDRTPFLQMAAYGLMYEEQHGRRPDIHCVVRMKDGEFEVIQSHDIEGDREGFEHALGLYRSMQNWGVADI